MNSVRASFDSRDATRATARRRIAVFVRVQGTRVARDTGLAFQGHADLDGSMGEKTFNLTWNNHLANLSGLFETLYKSGSLTDVTLACQGGMLRAHRLVLAACSPYFERVFKEHYGEQPILILKGTYRRNFGGTATLVSDSAKRLRSRTAN